MFEDRGYILKYVVLIIVIKVCSWLLQNQKMCNKAVKNYPHPLEFVPDCYMIQEMCDKVVNTHSSTIQFVPKCYNTQKMCDKGFNKYFLAFIYIPDR